MTAPLILALVLACPSFAAVKWSRVGAVLLNAGVAADVASSWNAYEANPMLRSRDGRFQRRGVAISLGIHGGYLAVRHFAIRRHPEWRETWGKADAVAGAARLGIASRNIYIRTRREQQ